MCVLVILKCRLHFRMYTACCTVPTYVSQHTRFFLVREKSKEPRAASRLRTCARIALLKRVRAEARPESGSPAGTEAAPRRARSTRRTTDARVDTREARSSRTFHCGNQRCAGGGRRPGSHSPLAQTSSWRRSQISLSCQYCVATTTHTRRSA